MSVKKAERPVVRSWMDFDTAEYDPGIDCRYDPVTGEETPSMTKQEFKDECDINVLMAKYEKTGIAPDHINRGIPQYGDFTDVPDLQQAYERVWQAEALFNALPAKVRERFKNDPSEMVSFVQDERNRDEAIELGLIARPPDPEPAPPPPPDPPAGGTAAGTAAA